MTAVPLYPENNDDIDSAKRCCQKRFAIIFVALVVLVAVIVGVVVGTVIGRGSSSPSSVEQIDAATNSSASSSTKTKTCFSDGLELRSAVSEYLQNSLPHTDVAKTYGWPIGSWCVGSVESFRELFDAQVHPNADSFEHDLSNWDVSGGTDMSRMFAGALKFNSDLSSWNVSKVTRMDSMFELAESFNQTDMSTWDVSKVTNMTNMFTGAKSFNAVVSSFNVTSVIYMTGMFQDASK